MLEGRIEGFDGRFVTGWSSGDLDVYLDDVRASEITVTPSTADGRGRFHADLGIDAKLTETPKITLKFAGTDINLPVDPPAVGFVNHVDFGHHNGLAEYLSRIVDSPCPPIDYLHYIGSGKAGRIGFLFVGGVALVELIYYGILPANVRRTIIDLGCGCGRVGLALGPYLTPSDRYIGLDTWAKGIEWAQQNISTRYPHLTFRAFPEINQRHRGGYQADQVFSFEESDNSVDAVIAMSLFTHLRLNAAAGYLREIGRVLRPGGRAFLTWFLSYENHSHVETSVARATREQDGYFVTDDTYVDAFLFENKVLEAIEAAGLRVIVKRYGSWDGGERTKKSRQTQDILVLMKP